MHLRRSQHFPQWYNEEFINLFESDACKKLNDEEFRRTYANIYIETGTDCEHIFEGTLTNGILATEYRRNSLLTEITNDYLYNVENEAHNSIDESLLLMEGYLVPSYNFLNAEIELVMIEQMESEKKFLLVVLIVFVALTFLVYFVWIYKILAQLALEITCTQSVLGIIPIDII